MKFAVINDTHVGPAHAGFENGVQRKLVRQAQKLMKRFVKEMNTEEKPEFVVHLGDFIEDVGHKRIDMNSLKKALSLLSHLKMPVYLLIGNHDVKSMSQEEVAKLFGYEKTYYSFDHGGYHFVALSFDRTLNPETKKWGDITISSTQLKWLKDDLARTKKPTIVFSHYGLADDDMVGNFWFEKLPEAAVIKNSQQVRRYLEKSGKVKAVISGHQHWNRMIVHNSVPYFTVTSLVENFNNDGTATEAFTIVELSRGAIKLEVKGNDPVEYSHKFRTSLITRLLDYLHLKNT